ncbi:MAG: hypothetical protein AAFX50_15810, partial [Acidobacteriota bacterium]
MLRATPTIRRAFSWTLLFSAILPAAGEATAPTCPDGSLGALRARPGTAVQVTAPGGGADAVRVGFGPDDAEALLLDSEVEGSEGVYFVVPPHPDGLGGGALDLTLDSAGRRCRVGGFAVEALEPAPGELRRYFESAITLARGTAEAAGVDPDAVDAAALARLDLRTLPPIGVPVALGLIHAAQLERDLAEIEARADPAALALLDAIVAASGWRDEVPEPVAVAAFGPALLEPVRIAALEMPFPT